MVTALGATYPAVTMVLAMLSQMEKPCVKMEQLLLP